MLAVQEWLVKNKGDVKALNEHYGINTLINPNDSRVVLNYDQIASSKLKTERIVRECRALVLDSLDWSLVARGFFRFFNWGEYPAEMKKFNFERSLATFKEDGSYIVVYNWKGTWYIQTRGSWGDGKVNDFISWRELFDLASPDNLLSNLDPKLTYVFELCSTYNQVVRLYNTPSLFLLTIFDGEIEYNHDVVVVIGKEIRVSTPQTEKFRDILDVEQYIAEVERKDKTFEGFVLRDEQNIRFKHKNLSYVALHRLCSNRNIDNSKHLIKFVLAGERDEVVTYFPYVASHYDRLAEKVSGWEKELDNYWFTFCDEKSRKKFAAAVEKCPLNWALFQAKTAYDGGDLNANPIKIMRENPSKLEKFL